jgi:hypothetical protein
MIFSPDPSHRKSPQYPSNWRTKYYHIMSVKKAVVHSTKIDGAQGRSGSDSGKARCEQYASAMPPTATELRCRSI